VVTGLAVLDAALVVGSLVVSNLLTVSSHTLVSGMLVVISLDEILLVTLEARVIIINDSQVKRGKVTSLVTLNTLHAISEIERRDLRGGHKLSDNRSRSSSSDKSSRTSSAESLACGNLFLQSGGRFRSVEGIDDGDCTACTLFVGDFLVQRVVVTGLLLGSHVGVLDFGALTDQSAELGAEASILLSGVLCRKRKEGEAFVLKEERRKGGKEKRRRRRRRKKRKKEESLP
jgi:hypothetical protein